MGNTECCSTSSNTDARELRKESKKHGKGKSIQSSTKLTEESGSKSPCKDYL